MSSIIGGMSQMSDIQSQIWQMYNKINNATIDAGQKQIEDSPEAKISGEEFAKALEEQYQKQNEFVLNNEMNFLQSEQLGMPAGLNITEVGSTNESYQTLINTLMESMMENLDKNSDGHLSQEEVQGLENVLNRTPNSETTGNLATNGSSFKNQASNFIQKLIDSYKDKGSINGLNV